MSVTNPCEDTNPNPVSVNVRSDLTVDKAPRVVVADKPVNPTTSAGVTVPRVVVALKPVKLNTADSTEPQPF